MITIGLKEDALDNYKKKKNRILLELKEFYRSEKTFKSLLNGVLVQDSDHRTETEADLERVTKVVPDGDQIKDLLFANVCVKHLKSNAIALVKNLQLIGMGAGQTSRVDAMKQSEIGRAHV